MRVSGCIIDTRPDKLDKRNVIVLGFAKSMVRNLIYFLGSMLNEDNPHDNTTDKIQKAIDDFVKSNHNEMLIVNPKIKKGKMLLMTKESSPFFNAGILSPHDLEVKNKKLLIQINKYFINLKQSDIPKYSL